ncbi:hypothetical protein ACIBQ1_35550 [Nonomuraea sp. NPDC050153]|uniref:hypothetical protein n=1 Tax=Nonomuraea sp. NPDC050153 TaxID=3364359 RepID=UPI0037B895D6
MGSQVVKSDTDPMYAMSGAFGWPSEVTVLAPARCPSVPAPGPAGRYMESGA